jgi:hypothetical protein
MAALDLRSCASGSCTMPDFTGAEGERHRFCLASPKTNLSHFYAAIDMIRKRSLFLISSSKDLYGRSSVRVLARVLPPVLSGVALASSLASSRPCPDESSRQATHQAPPSAQAPLPTRLSRLSSCLHSLIGCRANACSCASLARGEKPTESPQTHRHPGVRLLQPSLPVLQDRRCS